MTDTIWKQELEMTDVQSHMLPRSAKILTVQMQHDKPCVWFTCDPKDPFLVKRLFHFVGTGHTIALNDMNYVGTVQLYGGDLVFHLFEKNG